MLTITIPGVEIYDERTNKVIKSKGKTISMEYSLVAISKWESKYHKPFLSKSSKTRDEMIDMYRFMTITQGVDPNIYYGIRGSVEKQIIEYMQDPMTAATFPKSSGGHRSNKFQTAETFYHNMAECGVSWSCEKWHINRLIALLTYCNLENAPKKNKSKDDLLLRNAKLNGERSRHHT